MVWVPAEHSVKDGVFALPTFYMQIFRIRDKHSVSNLTCDKYFIVDGDPLQVLPNSW